MLPSPLVNHKLGSKYLKHNVLYDYILELRSAFCAYFSEIYLNYIFKVIFIHKNEGYIMFDRLSMVLNVEFQDIQALEPLPKFGLSNAFVTSKNRNFLFWLGLRMMSVHQINCFTHFLNE